MRFCFLFFIVSSLSAQLNQGFYDDLVFLMKNTDDRYQGVAGTPYLTKGFIPAKIDNIKETVFLRLNSFENTIELKKPDGDIFILSKSQDYRFKLNESQKEYETHAYGGDKGKEDTAFFEKIHDGKMFKLFIKENIKLIPKKIAQSGFEQDTPAKFVKLKDVYYVNDFKSKSSRLIEVPNKKKAVDNVFGDKSKSIQEFIKKQRLRLDNKDDLVQIFNFYFAIK